MGAEFKGWLELTGDLQKMADEFVDEGGKLGSILSAGAVPILDQARLNCPVKSGALKRELTIKVKQSKTGWYKARIGVMKGGQAFYATMVEYGHGGPHPAPAHPFLSTAYDLKVEDAYSIIRAKLTEKLTKA